MYKIRRAIPVLLPLLAIALGLAVEQVNAQSDQEKLMHPDLCTEQAPDVYRAKFETTKGAFVIEVTRKWAPLSADRFYNLVKYGYYDDSPMENNGVWAIWFGLNGNPILNKVWTAAPIAEESKPDVPYKDKKETDVVSRVPYSPNKNYDVVTRRTQTVSYVALPKRRGYVCFLLDYPENVRTTEIGIVSYKGRFGEVCGLSNGYPLGFVTEGIKVIKSIKPYVCPRWEDFLKEKGNIYLKNACPKVTYIKSAVIVSDR
jgi:hypothetical protein